MRKSAVELSEPSTVIVVPTFGAERVVNFHEALSLLFVRPSKSTEFNFAVIVFFGIAI